MKYVSFATLAAALALTGCAYTTSPYSASAANVEKIRAAKIKPVAVGTFTAAEPGRDSILCRAAGPVTVKPNFEEYIKQAFVEELKIAGAYDSNAQTVLTGRIDSIDFSSGMTDGNWTIALTVSNNKSQSVSAKAIQPFAGSFVADKACQEVAQAFSPAVQRVIAETVSNPSFKSLSE